MARSRCRASQVDGDDELRGLPAGGRQFCGAERELADVNQGVGAAGRRGAQVGAGRVADRCASGV